MPPRVRWQSWVAGLLLALTVMVSPARAHDNQPLFLSIVEDAGDSAIVLMRAPQSIDAAHWPSLRLPGNCNGASLGPPKPEQGVVTRRFHCPGGLEGRTIELRYPAAKPLVSTLVRVVRGDGEEIVEILPPDQQSWTIPRQSDPYTTARDYLMLGVEHIWGGADHLLFVAGLVLLAGTWRRILLTVTGFTIAHSVTLALATLDIVHVKLPPIEAIIALSILFLARELATPAHITIAKRYPLLVASSFGLLHGFGFAGALRDVGLPQAQVAIGLLFFNLGVEVGQIAFVCVMLLLLAVLRRFPWRMKLPFSGASLSGRETVVGGYVLGTISAFWFIDRMMALV